MSIPPDMPLIDLDDPVTGRRPRWLLLALLAAFAALAVPFVIPGSQRSAPAPLSSPLLGQPAPEIGGSSAGGPVSLTGLRGRWVLVNFFATWCGACRVEHQEIQAFVDEHASGDATALSVVHGDSMAAARAFFRGRHATWPLLEDPGEHFAGEYLVDGLPQSVLVAPDGRVAAVLVGGVHRADLDAVVRAGRSRT